MGKMKNRDYTGLSVTPSSMVWLIGQRARIKGQLDRLRRLELTLPERIKAAEAEMAALDTVIPLHEVKVDPQIIQGRRAKRPPAAPHGAMTRFLLKRLRLAKGKPVFTAELAFRFAREHNVDLSVLTQAELMDRVGRRLGVLTSEGVVRRHHSTTTNGPGSWSLMPDDENA